MTFDPSKYLSKVSGQDYLEVKWRLVWLREEHPNAIITTDLVSHDTQKQLAVFKATIEIPTTPDGEGGGIGTGHGSEQYGDFRDYLEKAETKAIGRALGALGFGTQFSKDHEFGADVGRVVDSPVKRPDPTTFQRQRDAAPPLANEDGERLASPPMRNLIGRLGGQLGHSREELTAMFGPSDQLTFTKASSIIDGMKAQLAELEQGDA